MSGRATLFFLAPIMPARSGNGLAMRAGIALEALASAYAVHLVVVPVAGSADPAYIPPFVRERTTSIFIDPLETEPDPLHAALASDDPARVAAFLLGWPEPLFCRFATPQRLKRLSILWAGVVPRIVHVMRLYMAPYAAPFLERRPRPAAVLDLDDDEVDTHADLSELHARNGRLAEATLAARESERFGEAERAWLGRFDRVLLASSADLQRVADRTVLTRLELVPNAVRLPRIDASDAALAASLLFVGNLSYAPNEDAAIWLCRELLPRLRARHDVRVRVVGGGAGPSLRALAPLPGVEIVGPVDDLAPEYRAAGVVVVPIRAGGGTRIKLIEALAYGKPVVSTSIGAAGIAVENGRHLLVADDPREFVQACLRLLCDPAEARSIGARGRELVRERYASDVVGARLVSLCRELYPSSSFFGGRWVPMHDQPRRVDGIQLEEAADGFMVHQPSQERVHYLNHTAAIVLELCDGKLNRDEIARALQQLYDLPSPPIAEVEECIGTLRQYHLID